MYHRRSQGDSKSTNNFGNSSLSIPTINHAQSTSSLQSLTTNRVSIYSMRERIILDKMTTMMSKLVPDGETEVTNRFHQEIPAVRLDGHLIYCLYITMQNLFHLNAIYILFYHGIFWLSSIESENEISHFITKLETTQYEETLFISISNCSNNLIKSTINVHLINKYIYITLIFICLIELITTFIWTFKKKLTFFIQRNQKWRNRLSLILIGIIIIIYFLFISWIFFHTFITNYLPIIFFFLIIIHFSLLIFLDKPNLFRNSSSDLFKKSFSTLNNLTRKQHRNSSSSSMIINPIGNTRHSHRSSIPVQSRKISSLFPSLILSSRWLSITEQQIEMHKCSTLYEQTRQEADDLWPIVLRRLALKFYRTFASFIFFDIIPFKIIDIDIRQTDNRRYKILIIIFALSTFLTHSTFLFPIKFQTNLHRLATHLGQWRLQSFIRTDTINEWSSECNSYTRGCVIKLSLNNNKSFIAIQQLSNAAHPQSISHSILYRLFGNITFFVTLQFQICIILICFQLFWIIYGIFWYDILISTLIILNSSYTIFKIIRDRLIFNMVEYNDTDDILLTSKQKKSN